jgi:hypothetical protein
VRKRGRPIKGDDFLALEIHRVMRAFKCGVRAACRRISRGDDVPLLSAPWTMSKQGTPRRLKPRRPKSQKITSKRQKPPPRPKSQKSSRWMTRSGEWKGENAGTLEQRYFRWLRREEERQKKLTIEIQ